MVFLLLTLNRVSVSDYIVWLVLNTYYRQALSSGVVVRNFNIALSQCPGAFVVKRKINLLSANTTKQSNTLEQIIRNS